jgi:hypothetical protein
MLMIRAIVGMIMTFFNDDGYNNDKNSPIIHIFHFIKSAVYSICELFSIYFIS